MSLRLGDVYAHFTCDDCNARKNVLKGYGSPGGWWYHPTEPRHYCATCGKNHNYLKRTRVVGEEQPVAPV